MKNSKLMSAVLMIASIFALSTEITHAKPKPRPASSNSSACEAQRSIWNAKAAAQLNTY